MIEAMSSLDAVFLAVEDARNPMNIGSVGIFHGPTPPLDEVLGLLADGISTITRCRQRVVMPRGPIGRAVWVTDARFDLRLHVRLLRLSDTEFTTFDDLVGALLADPLDRNRPLWEMWVVDGLNADRWAIVAKMHHCMADGIAGSDLLSALFTDRANREPQRSSGSSRAVSSRSGSTSALRLLWFTVRTTARTAVSRIRGALDVLAHPRRSWVNAASIAAAARRLWLSPSHPPTSLVGEIGTGRRWVHFAVPLEHVTTIRSSLGGTVNDVVVTAISTGFHDLLVARGESVEGRTLTAMVPVSLRRAAERGATGNRVANVHAPLPIAIADPPVALRHVRASLDELKDSHETDATGLLLRIGDYVPRLVADRVARAVLHRQRDVETVITNVPGPVRPLRLGPHEMVEGYPVAPIGGRVRITVAVWSYGGQLAFGITGDRNDSSGDRNDSTGDLDLFGRAIIGGFERLLEAAESGPGPLNKN